MSQTETKEFGKWRSMLWPIHKFELKKFLPMFFLFFFINFVYTILRDTKDILVVSASGAETIPFLKLYGTIPGAIIFMLIFTKLSNVIKRERLFMGIVVFFAAFFAMYAAFLYPAREAITPVALTNWMYAHLPQGLNGLIGMLKFWPASLFYIMAELWGSAAVSLLFWGFANQITKVSESKRFYALFGIGANLAMFPSGQLIKIFANLKDRLPAGVDTWQVTLNYTLGTVVVACLAAIAIYWWINRNVLTDPRFYDPGEVKTKKAKPKMSIKESLLYLVKSPYLLAITMLVIGYGMSINPVEVIWKSQLNLQYPDKHDYQHFMGNLSQVTGAITILMMFFVSGNVIRKKGWGVAAMTTPVILGLSALGFFTFVIFSNQLSGLVAAFGTTPLFFAVIFGMIQNVMSKSTKYSMFDPTKEMAYIPLDSDVKLKGKAAIDVVGARLGKSGGAFILQLLFIVFNAASAITLAPYIGVIVGAIIFGWILAVKALNKKYTALTAQREAEQAAALQATKEVEATETEAPKETAEIATK